MKHRRGLMICLALALAGVLLLAGPGWAQNQGGPGKGPAGQGNQLCTGGPNGTCVVPPANTPNTQKGPGYGAGKSQRQRGAKGPQGSGSGNQPNTQANPPATSR